MAKKLLLLALSACCLLGLYVTSIYDRDHNVDMLTMEEVSRNDLLNAQTTVENTIETILKEDNLIDAVSGQKDGTLAEIETLLEESGEKYTFSQLTEENQHLYAEILYALKGRKEDFTLTTTKTEDIAEVFQCVLNDHPELFFAEGYMFTQFTKGDEIVEIKFSGTYTMEPEQIAGMRILIDNYVDTFLAGMPLGMSEYEKVKYVYEYLISHTEYDLNANYNQTICSVFIDGRSVCQGYAKAMQYLLDIIGMNSTLVIGTVNNGEGHAWNLVRVEGNYYYVDATWGDASYQTEGEDTIGQKPGINYDFLCVTTEQLMRTHQIDNVVPMPVCVNTECNYYIRENCYVSEYDPEILQGIFDRAFESQKKQVVFRCATRELYENVKEELIYQQEIFQYMQSDGKTIAYSNDDVQKSFCFWVSEE